MNELDPFSIKPFPFANRARRFVWSLTWSLLCRFSPIPLHEYRSVILRCFGAKIGRNNHIYPSCKIWDPALLVTEDVVTIARDAEIYNPGGVSLGHHTIISQGAYLCGATHDFQSKAFTFLSKPITTEPYVWICAKAIVLPGVHCEVGSILGAGSLTSKSLKAWTVNAGNPAKYVKDRNVFSVD